MRLETGSDNSVGTEVHTEFEEANRLSAVGHPAARGPGRAPERGPALAHPWSRPREHPRNPDLPLPRLAGGIPSGRSHARAPRGDRVCCVRDWQHPVRVSRGPKGSAASAARVRVGHRPVAHRGLPQPHAPGTCRLPRLGRSLLRHLPSHGALFHLSRSGSSRRPRLSRSGLAASRSGISRTEGERRICCSHACRASPCRSPQFPSARRSRYLPPPSPRSVSSPASTIPRGSLSSLAG